MDYVFHRDTNDSLVPNCRCWCGSHGCTPRCPEGTRHARLLSCQSSSLRCGRSPPARAAQSGSAAERGQALPSAGPGTSCAVCRTAPHVTKAPAALRQRDAHSSANGTTNFSCTPLI